MKATYDFLVEKFDGELPGRRYEADGEESFSSRVRRVVHAYGLQKAAEKGNPALRDENSRRLALAQAEDRKARCAAAEDRHWAQMPNALRDMGLQGQELYAVGAYDDTRPAAQAVDAWLKDKASLFLTLGGPPGTGKTIAAAFSLTSCREYVRCESFEAWQWRPSWGRFVKASDLARLSQYDDADKAFRERLEFTRLLVIDDLGAEYAGKDNAPWRAMFGELVDARARRGNRTVLTTNLAGEAFRQKYDARVMRRLKDFGQFVSSERRAEVQP